MAGTWEYYTSILRLYRRDEYKSFDDAAEDLYREMDDTNYEGSEFELSDNGECTISFDGHTSTGKWEVKGTTGYHIEIRDEEDSSDHSYELLIKKASQEEKMGLPFEGDEVFLCKVVAIPDYGTPTHIYRRKQ